MGGRGSSSHPHRGTHGGGGSSPHPHRGTRVWLQSQPWKMEHAQCEITRGVRLARGDSAVPGSAKGTHCGPHMQYRETQFCGRADHNLNQKTK